MLPREQIRIRFGGAFSALFWYSACMPDIPKARMSRQERELRSRLAQLLTRTAVVRGSLSVREKSCGKPTCRCARGEKHRAVYLVASEQGKLRQLFIPRSLEADARECVEAYQRIRELLEELSRLHWGKLKQREL